MAGEVHQRRRIGILRIHGQRPDTELWTYGKAAEPILADWLRLRYALMPYIYSLGRHTYDSGAPFMRALFMDFPNDLKVATIGDQYMFGPAFLVAPVTEQGQTKRPVYLPAGTAWYDYWTNQRYEGGQTIKAIGQKARVEIAEAAEAKVHLFLFVKVRENWSDDPERYREMGLDFPKS